MEMTNKTIFISIISAFVVGGFLGTIVTSLHNKSRTNLEIRSDKMAFISYRVPLELRALKCLRERNNEEAIKILEKDLDVSVVTIGIYMDENNDLKEYAMPLICEIAHYRKSIEYKPRGAGARARVSSILQRCSKQ